MVNCGVIIWQSNPEVTLCSRISVPNLFFFFQKNFQSPLLRTTRPNAYWFLNFFLRRNWKIFTYEVWNAFIGGCKQWGVFRTLTFKMVLFTLIINGWPLTISIKNSNLRCLAVFWIRPWNKSSRGHSKCRHRGGGRAEVRG